jgi:hypothetical protein
MFYEDNFLYAINNNDFEKFQQLINEKKIDPFAYEMDYVELCVQKNRIDFITFIVNQCQNFESFDITHFLLKISNSEFNNASRKVIDIFKKDINFLYKDEILIKKAVIEKNEELLEFYIKELNVLPFTDRDQIIGQIIENNLIKTFNLLIENDTIFYLKDIICICQNHSHKVFEILQKNEKILNNIKINNNDAEDLLISYLYSNSSNDSNIELIKYIYSYINESNLIKIVSSLNRSVEYNHYLRKEDVKENNNTFNFLLKKIMKKENNYKYLRKIFYSQVMQDNKNNVNEMFKYSEKLNSIINKKSNFEKIKDMYNKSVLYYLYNSRDLNKFLKYQDSVSECLIEIFKDKNINKIINKNKLLKKVEEKKLKEILSVSNKLSNF